MRGAPRLSFIVVVWFLFVSLVFSWNLVLQAPYRKEKEKPELGGRKTINYLHGT